MKYPRLVSCWSPVLLGVCLAAMFLAACKSSSPSAATPARAARDMAASSTVYVQFEGPWAFVPDPQDSNTVIAIAPKTAGHFDLFVKASNEQAIPAGVFGLSLPVTTAGSGTLDPGIVQTPIGAANLQHAMGSTGGRYAIRLPKPEAYVAAGRAESRVAAAYPPPASTQDSHVTAVSLRYTVNSLTGFTISGTPDAGAFNPFLLNVETPLVRIVIEPTQVDDPLDHCETHSREAFRDLVKLLGLTLYADFPAYTAACQHSDPQLAAVRNPSALDRLADLLQGGPDNGRMQRAAMFEFLSFAHPTVDCHAPILVGQ